ncbi:C2H2-type zinc finger transcription factor [Rhizophagus irregularis DAOM 181602=DAOM 197198]|nr:C2H2-type zinc finger transcription factor [Rhizophagus irregularis DAOM 181602=DAOM 197198]
MDTFLDETFKKSVSDGFRQRNREKKLLHESATQYLSGVSNETTSSVIKDEKSQSHKKRKAENIVQDLFDFTATSAPEKNHMTEISMTRARDIHKLFEKIGIDKIKYITTYSANSISELSDSQIQTIVDYFSKNPNTELPDDQDGTIINFEEDILNDQDNVLEEQAKPLVSATRAKVSIPTAPIPLTHVSNSSGDSSSSKKLDAKVKVVPPIPQPETLVHDRSYFSNKTLDQYPNLYREFSSEDFDYYGINDETLCPLCKLDHDDEEGIDGFWENTDEPSLKNFLDFRLLAGDLEDMQTEYHRYKKELDTIGKFYAEVSEPGQEVLRWKNAFKLSKQSAVVKRFWKLHAESQNIAARTNMQEKKAKAKVLKLQTNQHVTIATVATKQIQQYARSTNTSIMKRFYCDDNEKTCEGDNSNSEGNDNFHAEDYDHQDLDQTGDEIDDTCENSLSDHQDLDQTGDEIDDSCENSLSDHQDLDQTDNEIDDTREKSPSFQDSRKWRLSTGKVVEDALYNFASKCSYEHASHSFIIDPTDQSYINEGIFTVDELNEIKTHKRRDLPEIPEDLLNYLMTFAKSTLHELRSAIDQPIKVLQGEFSPEKHHDYDWARYAMYTILQEYETGSLRKDHHERWYNMHLWCPIVDRCFSYVDDMDTIRDESCSIASGIRKNANRTASGVNKMERQKVGRRGDFILRTSSNLEFGGAEAGRTYKTDKGTKWLVESGLKLPKLLKDMIVQLASNAEWSTPVLRNLKTIGFVHADCRQMLLELDCPEGYVCRLSRGNIFKVADSIVTHTTETLPLIAVTWRAKETIQECLNIVRRRTVKIDDEKEVLRIIRSAGSNKPSKMADNNIIIPDCFGTPLKKKAILNQKNSFSCA